MESPAIFSQVIANNMAMFNPTAGSQIFVYVDDILVASPTRESCERDSLACLKFLAEHGHKASLGKLQWCAETDIYLGYNLNGEGRKFLPSRITAIQNAPKPRTKR